MKITLIKTEIEYAVNIVGKALTNKADENFGVITINSTKDNAVSISASNGEMTIEYEAKAETEVLNELAPIKINGKLFSDTVRKLPEGEIEIVPGQGKIDIVHIYGTMSLPVISGDSKRQITNKSETFIQVNATDLKTAVKKASSFVAADNSRPLLKGINIRTRGETATFVACDGFRLTKINVKAEREEKLKEKLSRQISEIAEKYTSLVGHFNGAYMCIIADSKKALVLEGETLHHCVGRMDYDQRIAQERSLIFFVRKTDRPEQPLATMEFSLDGKVRQLYGAYDSRPDETLRQFVYDEWLPQAKKALAKIKKKAV